MKTLKRLGRIFLVLTEEERYIKLEDIKGALVINLQELHFEKALAAIKERFLYAEVKIISGNAVQILSDLYKLRDEQFSAIIVLSFNPFVIFFVNCLFSSYFLIYNKFGQWFLIRWKTLYELLLGRRGADKEELDWKFSPAKIKFAGKLSFILSLPFVWIKNIFRGIWLILYIIFGVLKLEIIRRYYKFIHS